MLELCKASDMVWSARMVAKWPPNLWRWAKWRRPVGWQLGGEGRKGGEVGVLTTWFACLSLYGRTDDSFYIVTI